MVRAQVLHQLLYLLHYADLNAIILAASTSCSLIAELLLLNEIFMLNGPSNHNRSTISGTQIHTVFVLHDAAVIWIPYNALHGPTWSSGAL